MSWNVWASTAILLPIVSLVVGYYIFIGAFPASVVTAFVAWLRPHDTLLQFLVFGIVFIMFIVVSPKLSQKVLYPKHGNNRIGIAFYKGKRALVVRDIAPYADSGLVMISGQLWSARASEEIAAGSEVVIIGIEGNHFVVREVR